MFGGSLEVDFKRKGRINKDQCLMRYINQVGKADLADCALLCLAMLYCEVFCCCDACSVPALASQATVLLFATEYETDHCRAPCSSAVVRCRAD